MSPLLARQLLPPRVYARHRQRLRPRLLAEKRLRRVALGPHLSFLFENAATVLYQVQEMARAEGLERPEELQAELDTYNALLAHPGALACTLLLELPDPAERQRELPILEESARAAYLRLPDGSRAWGRPRGAQVPRSGVHFLAFPTRQPPVALGVAGPRPREQELGPACREALARDLWPQSGAPTLIDALAAPRSARSA